MASLPLFLRWSERDPPIQGGHGNARLVGDLRHRQFLDVAGYTALDVVDAELWLGAGGCDSCERGRAGSIGAFEHVDPLHLGEQAEHRHADPAHGIVGRGVDDERVVEGADPDAALGELVEEVERLPQVPYETIEFGHHQDVAAARVRQQLSEPGAIGVLAGLLVGPDLVDAGLLWAVELGVERGDVPRESGVVGGLFVLC